MNFAQIREYIINLLRGWITNKKTLDKISEDNGKMLFDNKEVGRDNSPIGTIISFMGKTAPAGYLACDGREYRVSEHQMLADFFLAQFGSYNYFGGNGVDMFKVPNLQGEFLRGSGTNGHTNQGSGGSVGVHQNATEHTLISSNQWDVYFAKELKTKDVTETNADSYINGYSKRADKLLSGSWNEYTGVNLAEKFTSRPTNTSVLYCIKEV